MYADNRFERGIFFENINITMSSFVFNFTIPAGAKRSFNLTIIDDNIANYYYYYYYYYIDIRIDLVVYEAGERVHCDYSYIRIEDNDGNELEASSPHTPNITIHC